jgi:hypothetical protein
MLQKGNMKQAPYPGRTDIRRYKIIRPDDLIPGVCAPWIQQIQD